MRTRCRRRPAPPADANELLAALRAGRLLPEKQLRRLAIDWSESRPDEPDDPVEGTRRRARELAIAGLLTAWQVEQVLAGEARQLRLGHYRLLEWLGAGGMGSVYKAEHRLMKRFVALKALREAASVGTSRREVEAAARLAHPNIVARPTTPSAPAAYSFSSWNMSRASIWAGSWCRRGRCPSYWRARRSARPPRRCTTPTSATCFIAT